MAYGHFTGDQVLRPYCWAGNAYAAQSGYPGALWGDEFILLLPETAYPGGGMVAERLPQQVAETQLPTERILFRFSISLESPIKLPKSPVSMHSSSAQTRPYVTAKQAGRKSHDAL